MPKCPICKIIDDEVMELIKNNLFYCPDCCNMVLKTNKGWRIITGQELGIMWCKLKNLIALKNEQNERRFDFALEFIDKIEDMHLEEMLEEFSNV